jgi:hypothetical protein
MRAREFITEHRLVFKKNAKSGSISMKWRCESGPRKGCTVPNAAQCSAAPDIKKSAKMKQTRKRTKVAQARKTKKTKRVNPMSRTAAMLNKKMRKGLRESSLSEIGYADELSNLPISDRDIIEQSTVDGQIGQRDVLKMSVGDTTLYYFAAGDKIEALLLLDGNRLSAMKNFTNNKGLIYALFNYLVNMKQRKVVINPTDQLTKYGIEWLLKQIERQDGFKITDLAGNAVNPRLLKKEWDTARMDPLKTPGPTGLMIGESAFGKRLRENESALMVYDIFGVKKSGLVESSTNDIFKVDYEESTLIEDTTSLNQIYQNDFPDRDEAFWDYVTNSELNNQHEIQTMQPYKLEILLKGQYRIEHIDELYDIMEPEQQEIVDDYMNSNLANQIIVIADNRIIDGNHRALAAVKSKQPIKFIDLDDIEETLQENRTTVRSYNISDFKQNVFENLSQYRRWAQSPKDSKRGMTRHYVDKYETVVRPELAESTSSFNTRKKEATAFSKAFKAMDNRDGVAIEVGESISVLSTVVVPSDKTSHIEVSGFVKPKQIAKINLDTDNKIDTIEFSDGSIFPEAAEFTTVGGVNITNTTFFPNYQSASKAYTTLWMMLTSMEGKGWKIEKYMSN